MEAGIGKVLRETGIPRWSGEGYFPLQGITNHESLSKHSTRGISGDLTIGDIK
jgi:hypothetical protein